jgi:predicted transcriptional regulator
MDHPMRRQAEKSARFTVSLSQADHETLQNLAEKNDVSIAWLVRKSIEKMLESNPQRDLFRGNEVLEVTRK